jgi:hypothetical protein
MIISPWARFLNDFKANFRRRNRKKFLSRKELPFINRENQTETGRLLRK